MIIKQIHLEKSRTIEVDGILGRDKYRKIVVGMHADLEDKDNLEESQEELSQLIDNAISMEIIKFRQSNKDKYETNKRQLLREGK